MYKPYIPPFFLSPSCTKYRQKHTGGTRRKISGYLKTFHLINFRVGRQWGNQPWHTEADYLKTWGRENTRRPSSAVPSLTGYLPCRHLQTTRTGAAAPDYLKQGRPHTCPKPCPLPSLLSDTSPQLWGFPIHQALASPPKSPACVSHMTV